MQYCTPVRREQRKITPKNFFQFNHFETARETSFYWFFCNSFVSPSYHHHFLLIFNSYSFVKNIVIYLLGQHSSHQFVCLLPLYLQLLCPLPDQVLKVGWVLLQHAQHGVNNVCLLPFCNALELQCDREETQLLLLLYCRVANFAL